MSSLAAIFRLLYSSEASFESKVEAAESLVKALLDGADSRGASAEAELPLLVRAHYLRSLLEWSCGAVTKKGGEAAGTDGNKGKKRKQQAGAATDEAARPPSLQPRCWAVLAAVLGSPATPASQPLPAALLPAATAALQALQRGGLAAAPAAAEAVALLDQLAALLRLLGSKFAGSFRPSTEHAAAAAEAALSGHAAATARRSARGGAASTAAQDWEAVAAAAVRLLLAAAVGHPNQRKVWDAAVPRLLPLLAGAGFPPGGPSEGSTPLLQAFCRQALEAVLFNPQHVQPLAAAAAAEMAAAVAEAEVAAGGEAAAVAPAAEGSAGAQHKGGAAAGYTAQLFTTLQRQVGERQLPLGLLPWMAGRFCTALRQHRRAAETEAAITGQSGRRSQQTAGGNEDTAGDGGSGAGSAPARPAGTGSGLSVSADFHFWLALLRTLSPRVSQLQQEGGHAGGSADLADAVSGVAGLAAALREHQLYRPTQDPAGQQHLLLQQLADAALQLAQQHGRSGHGNSSGSDSAAAAAAAAGVLPAALGVLQGILAVEHRVIQQQLPLLWPLLLWSPEAAGRGGNGGVAAVVACSLVAAFAELRQLEVLLQSLTAALLQEPMRQQAGGEADTAGSAAAAVLRSSTFRAALAAAVRQLPSGQVPMVLRLAAEGVGQLTGTTTSSSSSSSSSGSTGGSSTGQLLVLELHSACLASLTIDLTTAAAAAMAAQALVAALGPALLPLLAAAAAGGASGASSSKKERKTGRKQEQARGEQALAPALLPALLRLHRQALAVHGRCAALHPEVSPLPGRHLQPPAAVLEEGCAGGAPAANGEQEGSAKKKRKKERQSDAGAAASSGGHMAALLAQLGRLAKGKAVKGSAWAAAVQGASAELATLTESSSSSGGSSSSGKKRKQQEIGGEAAIATTADALHAVQRQAELLGQLPLSYLPSEAAAGMAALAVGSLLCCCRASLTRQSQPALLAALPAASACMSVLARLAGARASADGGLASQLQLLPQVLKAALAAMGCAAACCDSGTSDAAAQQVAAAADHSSTAMQAVCAEYLAAADGGSLQQLAEELSRPLAQEQQEGRWAAAVLAQACLSACCTAAGATGSASGNKAAAEIACGGSSQQACSPAVAPAVGAAATRIEAAVAAALPPAAAAALDGWRQATLTGVLYGCSAQLLRLHCCDSPAADELGRQQQQQAGGSGCVSGMAGALQAAAGLLDRLLPPAEQHGREQGGVQGSSAAALLVCPLLEYVAACCAATGRMRPAASSTHYASLLALLLHLLARQPACGSGPIPPSRHTLPFAAAFPAATAVTAHQAPVAGSSNAAGVRPLLLEALRDLVAGSSSQQLLLPLRFAEAALPAAPAGSGAALAHCELLLALVEEAGGNRQQRLLGQHSEHIAVLLTAFVSTTAYASPAQWQQSEQQQHREQQTFASLRQLAAAILAAAGAEGGSASANPAAAAALAAAPTPPGQQPCSAAAAAPTQAEVAALCTALRVLESLSARPKLFPLPAAATCSILSSVAAVWTAYAEGQQQAARLGSSAAAAPLPGFRYRLDASSGAGLFAGSCHLLMALLRHRQQDLRRCLPLLLQALRALLRFLAAAELSARLQLRVLAPAGVPAACSVQQWQQEQRWRLKCAELLAGVLAELAGLKDVGVGRYCPQLLADYLLLAAAPPSGRSKALLHFSSPAATLAARRASHSDSGGSHGSDAAAAAGAAAAAAAEMDALAGEPLSPAVAAALRRGAFALYGACSASEIQFLYASLGSGGAGAAASWRGALAALKADFEKHYKYTGKV
ncbi:hypothetical protein ABPG75_007566 [Micractinium tetrahymenae]